jgi:hypothetical protein
LWTTVSAQNDSINNISSFTLDRLGNCYAIKNGYEIIKMGPDGKVLNSNSRRDLGTPDLIDATDPLRILVFYRDFAYISIYDNRLSKQNDINLRIMNISSPTLIASANDGGIWVFDMETMQLYKIDINLNQSKINVDIRQLLNKTIKPVKMEVSTNYLCLADEHDSYIFDQFGTYSGTLKGIGAAPLYQLNDNQLSTGDSTGISKRDLKLVMSEQKLSGSLGSDISKMMVAGEKSWQLNNKGELTRSEKKP